MKHFLPALDSLKVVEAAARHLSFSQAASELCITKSAISYQIRRLEEDLDCALFRRSVRQVYLTNAGQQLLQTTQQIFTRLNDTLQKIRPGDSPHDVLVGATTYVALRWLSPRISGFSESNPEISILLQHAVNRDDFSIQEVDFAIRWCRMEGLVDRNRVLELPMPLYPVCSPALLERYQPRAAEMKLEPGDLNREPLNSIPLLCEDRSFDLWQAWYGRQQPALQNPRRIIADANVRTQAAVDGQGWTMADALMQRELETGDLVAPFDHQLEGYGYAIQSSAGRFVSQKAMELRQWLVDNA